MKHNETRRGYTLIGVLGITVLALLMLVSTAGAEPFAYIGNFDSANVSVIDTDTNTVIASVPVSRPMGIAVSPDFKKVYVSTSPSDTMGDSGYIYVIDTATNSVMNRIMFKWGFVPYGVAVTPDGTKIYVTNRNNATVIDTATNQITAQVPVGYNPRLVAVSPDGAKVYVTNYGSANVSVIDTATNNVTATVDVGQYPFGVAVTPDRKKVYVGNYASKNVSIIDTATNTVTATVNLVGNPEGIVVTPDGKKVYVGNSNNVSVIDTATNTVTADVYVGLAPKGIAVTPDGTKVYAVNSGSGTVSVIDTATDTVIASVPVGKNPRSYGQFISGTVGMISGGANLYLSNSAPESKKHGSLITYKLYYFNFGNASAGNVILEDKLPNDVEFESASDGGVYDSSTRTVRWNIGSVNSAGHGYRNLNVSIPEDVTVGTVIINNANISTSDPEVQYNDNEAQAKTFVTGSTLPPGVGVEPNFGGIGKLSINRDTPITFSYHNDRPVTAVGIRIHVDDGKSDIIGNMTGGPFDWTYTTTTTTFFSRHGAATVTYTVLTGSPYTADYDLRSGYGNYITADDIETYIKQKYPDSVVLQDEPNIGDAFMNAATNHNVDPLFLVAVAELESGFVSPMSVNGNLSYRASGLVNPTSANWALSNPGAHNMMGWGLESPNMPVTETNSAATWGGMVEQVAAAIQSGYSNGFVTIADVWNNFYFSPINIPPLQNPLPPVHPPQKEFLKKIGPISVDMSHPPFPEPSNPVNYTNFTNETESKFPVYIDPAGYIYDLDTGERISGANVWLQQPDEQGVWENVLTGQIPAVSQPDTNPLITSNAGQYQWDVLEGAYRVHVEALGYEPADSIVVCIPPPVTDLHVGLNHIDDPNIPPILPVANFSTDVSSGYSPLSVKFTDLSEKATGWKWDFGDGATSTDRYPIHTYSAVGSYTVTLTVSNGNGANSATGTIDVQAVPVYPVSKFSYNATMGEAPISVQFTDLSENTTERKWDFGDGTNSVEQSPAHTYSAAGYYIVKLTVSNDNGADSSFAIINVFEHHVTPPQSIVVEAGSDQTVEEGTTVNFDGNFTASGSHTYSYHWDFGDGSEEDSSLTTSHVYADNGVYAVNLTVTDEEGDFGNDTLLVTVNNAIPVVDSGSDLEVTAGDPVSFSGTFSDPGWLDIHTAEWNFGEGTVGTGSVSEENEYPNSTGTVSGNSSYFDAGEYTVTLNVTDDDGGIGQDQLTVTVRPIRAEVTFDPETLYLNSTGDWVTAYIELPVGYNVSDIGSVLLNGTVHAVSDPKYDFVTNESEYMKDIDLDGISERMFKFNRGDVARILKVGDKVTVTFTGKVEYDNGVSSGMASFEGSDVIKVTDSKNKKG